MGKLELIGLFAVNDALILQFAGDPLAS